jgi:hypothetical protein
VAWLFVVLVAAMLTQQGFAQLLRLGLVLVQELKTR